jgi:hypothetical protein
MKNFAKLQNNKKKGRTFYQARPKTRTGRARFRDIIISKPVGLFNSFFFFLLLLNGSTLGGGAFCGTLCRHSLRPFSSFSGSFLPATRPAGPLAGRLPGFTFTLPVDLVEVNQLDQRGFGIITNPGTQLDDPGISTRTARYFGGHRGKQFGNGFLVLQIAEYYPALMGRIVLCFGDQGLDIGPQGLGFCQCSNDPLMRDQLTGQIAQQRTAVSGGPAQILDFVSVTHDCSI